MTVGLTRLQADGAVRAAAIIDRFGGVLIADATGLGKTFIAIAIIENAIRDGTRPILITAPAALRAHWKSHLPPPIRLARSSDHDPDHVATTVGWASHTALSLGTRLPALPSLIVVDESHAFRNPRTRRYRCLARLSRAARIVLISATPVNNSLWDLYFQLRLFLADGTLRQLGVPDLHAAFRQARPARNGRLPSPLREAIANVIVRRARPSANALPRTRSAAASNTRQAPRDHPSGTPDDAASPVKDLQPACDRWLDVGGVRSGDSAALPRREAGPTAGRTLAFPHREPPRLVRWAADAAPDLYPGTVRTLASLELAPFRRPGGEGSIELVRFGLLKRLESSLAAFALSLRSLRSFLGGYIDAATAGFLMRPRDRSPTRDMTDGEQLFLPALTLRPLPPRINVEALIASARRDLDASRRMLAVVEPVAAGGEPKIDALTRLLTGPLAGRKVLVFTEYRDTARHIGRALAPFRRIGRIDGSGAFLGPRRASRSTVINAFAPRANRVRPPADSRRVDVLIATDVLSEGFNLQDAADVISFDLPWNPVRLIQRIGRIDRLGAAEAIVRCWNFIPDRYLEDMLGLVARLEAKLRSIRAATGRTSPVLARTRCGDAVPVPPRPGLPFRDDAVADSPTTGSIERRLRSLASGDSIDLFRDVDSMAAGPGLVEVLSDPGLDEAVSDHGTENERRMAQPEVLQRVVRRPLRLRLAGRIVRMLARLPGGADPSLCVRAERVVTRLNDGFRAGVELEIDALERESRTRRARRNRQSENEIRDLLTRVEGITSVAASEDTADG